MQVLMAYDMDDEDELWLAKHNAKVGAITVTRGNH
jgi:hypothetical protein